MNYERKYKVCPSTSLRVTSAKGDKIFELFHVTRYNIVSRKIISTPFFYYYTSFQ